ncbi:MAG TPA: hypothetical protein VG714_01190 [Acidobacteriaceae bacterium]|nr:hypothetical protein [Acidobacteriaceae bacterium]
MSLSSVSVSSKRRQFSACRAALALAGCLALSLPALLTGCKRASATSLPSAQDLATARQQMDLIPPPSKTRYMAVHSLSVWENPYLTVQQNMATLHITVADANPSSLGVGGMLRPVGAREQNVTVRLSDLPDALSAVPDTAWPYGRVVAVEEAHDTPPSAEPAVRRNIEVTLKMLNDLGVVAYDWTDGNGPH